MKSAGRILLLLLATAVALLSLRYFNFQVRDLLFAKGDLFPKLWYKLVFYTHAGGGALALMAGPWQFFPRLRNHNLRLHRRLGLAYVVLALLSGLAGVALAFFAEGGWITTIGFGLLGIGWTASTAIGFRHILHVRVESHYRWMMRSYAFCLAAVTLRLWIPVLQGGLGLEWTTAYQLVSFLCWIPNLAVAEWILYREAAVRATPVRS